MKQKILSFSIILIIMFLVSMPSKSIPSISNNKQLDSIFNSYYEKRLELFPMEATNQGNDQYNDRLPAEFTDSYRLVLKEFYSNHLTAIQTIDRAALSDQQKLYYDIFKKDLEMAMEGLTYHNNYIPFDQYNSLPLSIGQSGSGESIQPFKTVKDYDNWLKRMQSFSVWADSAIIYFRKGMANGYVLPKALVIKMIPQMDAMVTTDPTKSLFYGPIQQFPPSFTRIDKERLTSAYTNAIRIHIIPSYKKLSDFLQKEYLPKARKTSGISALPNGNKYYNYQIRLLTTTNKTADEIYQTGLAEVKRIREEMENIQSSVGFKGSLNAFFNFMKNDKQFMPFVTAKEVLDSFERIRQKIDPKLKSMFGHIPRTKFEIRQTEAFRAASASAEYVEGTPNGSRAGIFYIPIINPATFNITSGMESLFLHEAIPGHHYQISLQRENENLPTCFRFNWFDAYGEGWALYCESLGRELDCYTNPYQYMGALGDEMLRAVRLVVDVGIHTKSMTREEAVDYMMYNQPIGKEEAIAAIERYMSWPGQALSYKIGALKIWELRNKYTRQLGNKFNLSNFHDEFLKDGCMPLDILEAKMDKWAANQ